MLHLSLKIPGKPIPSRLPNGGLFGESCPFPEPSPTCLSNSSINILLIERNFTLLLKALGKECPHVPHNGAPMETHRFPEPYLAHPLGSPVKEPFLQVPLLESLRHTSPLPGSQWGPYGEDTHLQSLPLHVLQGPQ